MYSEKYKCNFEIWAGVPRIDMGGTALRGLILDKLDLEAKNFLKENGILVIEDIYLKEKGYSEELYYKNLSYLKKEFSDIFFCICEHEYNYSGFWNNCKLLVLIK